MLVLARSATAEPVSRTPDVRAMHVDDCARARKANKPCVIDMGKAEDVVGDTSVASGSVVTAIDTAQHPSLLPIRRDFIIEILKTAEDL
jgi:hypothetical protein